MYETHAVTVQSMQYMAQLYVCVFLFCFSGDDMSLLVTEKVKQTVKVPDVSMDTSQDGEHNEDTELVVLSGGFKGGA